MQIDYMKRRIRKTCLPLSPSLSILRRSPLIPARGTFLCAVHGKLRSASAAAGISLRSACSASVVCHQGSCGCSVWGLQFGA